MKGYGFMSFAGNFKKTSSKRILKESAKATGDLIGNKITDKITAKPIKNDVYDV